MPALPRQGSVVAPCQHSTKWEAGGAHQAGLFHTALGGVQGCMHHLGVCSWKAFAEVGLPNPRGLVSQPQTLARCIRFQSSLQQFHWALGST